MNGIEQITKQVVEKPDVPEMTLELPETKEFPFDLEDGRNDGQIERPDMSYILSTSREALMAQSAVKNVEKTGDTSEKNETKETKQEGLSEEEKAKIKEETGWPDEIIDSIENMDQYEKLKNANLKAEKVNGKWCLLKENIDMDFKDEDGLTNRERMKRGLAPLDSKTGKPIELHHLGQKQDSPLVELTEEEHRTGEYKDGKKNQSLWHNNTKETEVHGEGSDWNNERRDHWKARYEQSKGEAE